MFLKFCLSKIMIPQSLLIIANNFYFYSSNASFELCVWNAPIIIFIQCYLFIFYFLGKNLNSTCCYLKVANSLASLQFVKLEVSSCGDRWFKITPNYLGAPNWWKKNLGILNRLKNKAVNIKHQEK